MASKWNAVREDADKAKQGMREEQIKDGRVQANGAPKPLSDKPPVSNPPDNKAGPPKPSTPAKYMIHSKRIFDVLAVVMALFLMVIIKLLRPGFFSTILYILVGIPAGVALSFLFFQRTRTKRNITKMMNITPGVKGIKYLTSSLPTWVNMADNEKAEWMNKILLEMWPFYDTAVCEIIKVSVDPILDQVKPPLLIKKIGFKKLAFGDAPFRIEAVRMDRLRKKDEIFLEIDFRWAGEANIILAIEPFAGGDATRMCPRISNLRCTGTVGVVLKPLVDEIPGFGAVLITLMKPPKISYRVDLGKALGGNLTGGAIANFVDGLLPSILNGFLVWPQRIVVPIFGEEITGPLDDLQLRHRGILKVTIIEAKDIPRMDKMGKSDPFLEFFTDAKRVLKTHTKKNTLAPVWNETHYLMVQEPTSQSLRWEMFDVDIINVKQMFKSVNVFKGLKDSLGSKEHMSKGELPLREICTDFVNQEVDRWLHCGPDDWSSDDGPGRGLGMVHMKLHYLPLEMTNPMVGEFGALFVRVRQGTDFPQMDPGTPNSCNAYYEAKVAGSDKQKSTTRPNTETPDWSWEKKEFFDIPNEEILKIKFMSQNTLTNDEAIGRVEIEIASIRQSSYRGQHGTLCKEYELEDADSGKVVIETQFVAYF